MDTPTSPSANPALPGLRITEIFLSLQGESRSVGWPTVFVRLTGCPLRCDYCDTAYAFTGGEVLPLADILKKVQAYGVRHVCVTGGEPLAQPACLHLLRALCDAGHEVSLETSGALDVSAVDPRVIKVIDLKTPGSGEAARNRWDNLVHLSSKDQVKFVICDRADYDWACEVLARDGLTDRVEVLFSVAFGDLAPGTLADWIVQDRLPVRFQLQLHKVLWDDARGR
ncbi:MULTISPECIES: 7-carboxy-7-deazaguanine synthase QueE [unclassified Ectothiorhodospira]|uniref:7-carboxy-7-deazaguanine synthase QueE n=1 Tax=unclassified Ectothiorhodospira TaxID=2684909 RepID=UPI001EE7F7F8|nr:MULTISPECIES: 7-carboxy-7-deazaguanine synthase QueE [unclassified Ectothiorhodospira]MCG5515908.1 7-carboxy-7-deazaguanine synthase QueE [Ectothiorhodospira sp. 9100]MCG5518752.1 7-carboxy-7-deazaguanine synthase QueE [Ectothiorhodospira sp. 9905]